MRMGDDYTSELTEFGGGTYLGGPTRWGSVQGGHTWNRTTPQHTSRFQSSSNCYEAEDILYGGDRYTGISRPRSGLYYSPPGTSYTIVESSGGSTGLGGGGGTTTTVGPESSRHHTTREYTNTHQYNQSSKMTPRGTYLGATTTTSTGGGGAATTSNSRTSTLTSNNINKKRPISPEQVLRLFGNNGHVNTSGVDKSHSNSRRSPASSPASTTHHNSTRYQSPSIHELSTRTVTMTRDPPDGTHGFGICVKGGKDAGVGVYISRVEEGSVAERAGLRPGDSILEVNGTPFTAISHEEALKMLKSCRKLSMTVRSPTLPGAAAALGSSSLPGNFIVRQTCSWMDRQGRPVSPPLEYQRIRPWRNQQPAGASGTGAIRRVDLCIEPGQSLGLMIRGGVEYNLGIFITGVDKDSVADRAGLLIGDQILEVNGQSFLDVTHDEAVNQLKFHKRMSLVVRDVGKVPHSCTSYDRGGGGGGAEIWDNQTGGLFPTSAGSVIPPPISSTSLTSGRKRNATLQMVEEKARCVLPKSDFPTLCYYTDEYICRRMTVDAFVAVMLELLNTPEKYTLLTELREIIIPEDRVRFDELVYRREQDPRSRDIHKDYDIRHSSRRKTGGMSLENSHSMLMSSLHDIGSGADYGTNENDQDYRSPSEDSGLGLAMADRTSRRPRRPASATPGCEAWYGSSSTAPGGVIQPSGPPIHHHRSSPPAITNTSDLDEDTTQNQEYGSGDEAPGRRSRRHSSPGDSRSGSATHLHQPEYDEDTELAHKLSRSFDMKDDQNLLDASGQDGGSGAMRRHQSMQRLQNRTGGASGTSGSGAGDIEESLEGGATSPGLATIVPDHQGNLRITVNKSKPILGIAIEGGANTKHPLPRIINIHENGAAFDAGGLEVGQLILEVDGQKVDGMQHQEVARLIAESFARRDRQEIEFLVVEAKKSNLEPKPTALIFLEA